jgi:hypothetical protein
LKKENISKYGIKELRDGLTLEGIQNDYPWILDAKIKDAIIGKKYGLFFWYEGTWIDGTWIDGIWGKGVWKKGIWTDGDWEYGLWLAGEWRNGIWEDGIWKSGVWYNGIWKGGIWISGTYYNEYGIDGVWYISRLEYKEKGKTIMEYKEQEKLKTALEGVYINRCIEDHAKVITDILLTMPDSLVEEVKSMLNDTKPRK